MARIGKQYDTVMMDNSFLRGLLRFTVIVVRAVLWLNEFLKAVSSLSAKRFKFSLSSGEGMDTNITLFVDTGLQKLHEISNKPRQLFFPLSEMPQI